MLLRNNTTLSEVMTTCIPNGPHCGKKETKQCQISRIYFIPCAPSWVSKIQSDIWCSSIVALCIDTSRLKWKFWTSHPWAWPTDIPSKSRQKLKQKTWQFGPGNPSQQNPRKGGPNPQNKGQRKYGQYQDNQSKPQAKKDTGKTKKYTGSGATSIRALGITLLTVAQSKSLVAEVKASESDAV
jgi:hypothetical protein